MDGVIELAKLFKERENISTMGIQIGKVISVNPLKIALGDKIILDTDDLVISQSAYYKYDLINGVLNQVPKLEIGDKIILLPATDEQIYIVMDKVVNL